MALESIQPPMRNENLEASVSSKAQGLSRVYRDCRDSRVYLAVKEIIIRFCQRHRAGSGPCAIQYVTFQFV